MRLFLVLHTIQRLVSNAAVRCSHNTIVMFTDLVSQIYVMRLLVLYAISWLAALLTVRWLRDAFHSQARCVNYVRITLLVVFFANQRLSSNQSECCATGTALWIFT